MPETQKTWGGIPGQALLGTLDMVSVSINAREVVVAKRGKDASHVEDGCKLDENIRSLLSSMSWAEIKENKYIPPYDDPCAHL
jgi:hypothetical protein